MNTRSLLRGLTTGLALLALPTAVFAADGFARSSGTLRAGAGSNYPAVMRISAGTSLDVVGCLSRYTWCDVAVDGERGWFPGKRIGVLRDGRRVYLSDGGARLGLTILSFGMADYWGSHYSGRPWYNERRWWGGRGPIPPPHRPGDIGGPPQHAIPPGGAGNPMIHTPPSAPPAPPHAMPPGGAGNPMIHTPPIKSPRVQMKPPAHVAPMRHEVEPQARPRVRAVVDPATRVQRTIQHPGPMQNSGQAPRMGAGRSAPPSQLPQGMQQQYPTEAR